MTSNQYDYYILGLEDAIREIDLELKNSKIFPMDSKLTNDLHVHSCRICKALVQYHLEGVKLGL